MLGLYKVHGDLGPFTLQQLQQLAARGTLNRSTLLRETKSTVWIRASQVPSIFDTNERGNTAFVNASTNSATGPSQPPTIARKSTEQKGRDGVPAGVIVGAASMLAMLLFFIGLMAFMAWDSNTEPVAQNAAQPSKNSTLPVTQPPVTQPPDNAPPVSDSPATPVRENNYSTEDLVTRTKESVALISTPTGSGSGFVAADGIVVTNYHVIAESDADSIEVYFPDGQDGRKGPFVSQLIAEEPERDLALLHIEQRVPKVEIDTTHKFRRGQDVVIIGSPGVFSGTSLSKLLPNAVTKGVLSSETVIKGYNHYQLSLAVNGGNSGGPVFGMDARVIGVVVSKSTAEDSISFCIPASDLVAMLQAQAVNGYKPTGRITAEHNARVTVNALTSQVISLEKFMNNVSAIISERSGKSPESIAANDIVISVKSYMEKESPELIKDYSFSLKQIVDDERLTARQRSEVESLMQRHRALKRIFDQPPPNIRQFTNDLRSLSDQFLNQLAEVNRSLQLGKPGVFN